jgi:predicted nucleic acid-binding protein
VTRPIADRYGQLARELREKGQLIGANDLWISATALHYELPLVTRNTAHFSRVPELQVLGY